MHSGPHGDRAACGLRDAGPLTHTVFFIPVELVRGVASAFVAAHCVHTDLLTAPVVDAALISVCRTKHSPVTAACGGPVWCHPSPEEGAAGKSQGRNPLTQGKVLAAFRMCTGPQLTPTPHSVGLLARASPGWSQVPFWTKPFPH